MFSYLSQVLHKFIVGSVLICNDYNVYKCHDNKRSSVERAYINNDFGKVNTSHLHWVKIFGFQSEME